jgi:uncharacterized damage-inducible protein DinB
MGAVDPADRQEPPLVADERTMLDGWLDYHRATLLLKCEGLSDEQLKEHAVPTTALTLLGLVRHLTEVERGWYLPFFGETAEPLYFSDTDPDGEFDVKTADAAADLQRYRDEVDYIRGRLRDVDLDATRKGTHRTYSLRWVHTHLIEEYARHNGHADLIREAIDGTVGE